jgi:hypothetical protein
MVRIHWAYHQTTYDPGIRETHHFLRQPAGEQGSTLEGKSSTIVDLGMGQLRWLLLSLFAF